MPPGEQNKGAKSSGTPGNKWFLSDIYKEGWGIANYPEEWTWKNQHPESIGASEALAKAVIKYISEDVLGVYEKLAAGANLAQVRWHAKYYCRRLRFAVACPLKAPADGPVPDEGTRKKCDGCRAKIVEQVRRYFTKISPMKRDFSALSSDAQDRLIKACLHVAVLTLDDEDLFKPEEIVRSHQENFLAELR